MHAILFKFGSKEQDTTFDARRVYKGIGAEFEFVSALSLVLNQLVSIDFGDSWLKPDDGED